MPAEHGFKGVAQDERLRHRRFLGECQTETEWCVVQHAQLAGKKCQALQIDLVAQIPHGPNERQQGVLRTILPRRAPHETSIGAAI